MRVIAGDRRGFRLETPPAREKTRPTEDRTKEAVFSIIQPILSGARVLDAFAGTGQIGIEFLSRGAGSVLFCELRAPMASVVRANVEKTKFAERSRILVRDVRRLIPKTEEVFDYVYLDPPFRSGMDASVMELLHRYGRLAPGALVIVESSKDDDAAEEAEGYEKTFDRTYGSKRIRIFKEES